MCTHKLGTVTEMCKIRMVPTLRYTILIHLTFSISIFGAVFWETFTITFSSKSYKRQQIYHHIDMESDWYLKMFRGKIFFGGTLAVCFQAFVLFWDISRINSDSMMLVLSMIIFDLYTGIIFWPWINNIWWITWSIKTD